MPWPKAAPFPPIDAGSAFAASAARLLLSHRASLGQHAPRTRGLAGAWPAANSASPPALAMGSFHMLTRYHLPRSADTLQLTRFS